MMTGSSGPSRIIPQKSITHQGHEKRPTFLWTARKLLLFAIATLLEDRPFLVPFLREDFGAGSDGDVLVECSLEEGTWDAPYFP